MECNRSATGAASPDASRADIEAVVVQSQKLSAVYDILTNPPAATVEVG
ncbi:hypothetical protein [Pseudonocardia sp.]|nr:hypothetical protein [Pseudonocardia sp.]